MKKVLTIAIAAVGIGFSAVSLAGHDRGRYYDGYRGHDRVVIHKHYHGKPYGHKHWKRHRVHRDYYYRPRHRSHVVVRHHHDDDLYKWIGGIYLLNEVLHHDRH